MAKDLHVGEHVQRLDDSEGVIYSLVTVAGAAEMWDLTVSNIHTFAVGQDQWVVHNCSSLDPLVQSTADGVTAAYSNESGVTVSHSIAKNGKGITINIAFGKQLRKQFIIWIMESGGIREDPYYRISNAADGALDATGLRSSDKLLTHLSLSENSVEEIQNIINNYFKNYPSP